MEVEEGKAKLRISNESKISKKLEVFYNPVMKLNRDVTLLLLNSVPDRDMQMALPLAGSGIRGIRFIKELVPEKIKNLSMNDIKTSKNIRDNLKRNKISDTNISIFSKDANLFMLESKGFDYIDIDPFGSPNDFLDASIIRLARKGILAVTATDTSALSGSMEKACIRKYWAKPMKNELMHEVGIRILIRKVQLIGAQHERSLIPIFSFAKDHYFRIFFRCEKGKQKADEIMKFHNYLIYDSATLERKIVKTIFNKEEKKQYAGPLWTGRLWDEALAEKMFELCDKDNKKLYSLISLIRAESKIDSVGFYDLSKLFRLRGKEAPKLESMIGKDASRTHFLGWGLRCSHNKLLFE